MKHAECAAWRISPAHRSSVKAIANHVLIALAIILSLALPASPAFAAASPDTFGVIEAYSTHTPGDTLMDGYGYTDDWFTEDPSQANDDLALASMQLVATAVTDGDAAGTDFLHGLGFENVGFSHFNTSDPDDCAYLWGTKAATDNDGPYTLVAIAIQSYALDNAIKTEQQVCRGHLQATPSRWPRHTCWASGGARLVQDVTSGKDGVQSQRTSPFARGLS